MSEIDPAEAAALTAEFRALLDNQQTEAVIDLAREGLKRFPDSADLRQTLGHSLLMLGCYRDGFRELEARVHRSQCPARALPYPEWDGPIAGRSILIWGEQGIGDEIQYARFIRRLRELGASRITLTCWNASVSALGNVGADLVVGRHGRVEVPKHDCWISLGSLPYRLGVGADDITGEPYLSAKPRGRGGIGLVERGSPINLRDAERSIPEGLLQSAIPQGHLLEPEGDVYDSLCRLAGLDLLITVDTSWAHMAGALGVPCWVLLPYRELDWRWMRERSDTPWYNSLRLFRQTTPGDWRSVLDRLSV